MKKWKMGKFIAAIENIASLVNHNSKSINTSLRTIYGRGNIYC